MPSREHLTRRTLLQTLTGVACLAAHSGASFADAAPANFTAALRQAAGQTVYFNAWGGDQRINDYILWAAGELERQYGILLRLVKLTDTAEAVSHVLADKAAGRQDGGSVDLVWINGENFAAMKSGELLFGPFTAMLPNFRLVDPVRNPTLVLDFTEPTEGFESPWGMAQFTFFYDSARIAEPPRNMAALRDWAERNPGRFTYPAPPDFIGTTFLKQALHELLSEPAFLQQPADAAQFAAVTAPLWAYLDRLHPVLWRQGRAFPESANAQRQLLNDGEVDMYMAFNPADASSAIAQRLLPESVRGMIPEAGSIANTHFLAIPFNANAKAGALVAANFLLSPEAQARKQDPAVWGDPTVLALDRLTPEQRAAFDRLPQGIATPRDLGSTLPEPHPSWVAALEHEWIARYAR
jgi:putative thiamine transport system substrate-binding protein